MTWTRCLPSNHHSRRLLEPWSHVVTALVVLLLVAARGGAWVDDARAKVYVQFGDERAERFLGNQSHKDHFKLLQKDHNWLLVGARNIVYNVSLHDLTEAVEHRIDWPVGKATKELCTVKGKLEDDCQNYIRVLVKINDEKLLVCGTNAYSPKCKDYRLQDGYFTMGNESEGKALCPFSPDHNSTSVYVDGQLYTATVADFSGTDPMIYRAPLRTERSDLKQLNTPNFVNSFAYKDYVFFFFREIAVEYINCGKAMFSRVARVCKHDKGGPHQFGDRWTSFLKSRLNCSVPGDYPFYFDEIQSTSDVIEGEYGGAANQLVYGVFTTPSNSISGSAVCAFSMQDVMQSFEGQFKEQETMNANWLAVQTQKVPEPRPGGCVNDSRTLPDLTVNFVKNHALMDKPVPSFFGQPVVIRVSMQYRFTQIAVDAQVETADGKKYDVLFLGTDNGKVIKTLNAASFDSDSNVSPVVVEEIQVHPPQSNIAIKNMQVMRMRGGVDKSKLVIISDDEVTAIKLHRCGSDKVRSCRECVALQDPYCAWSVLQERCVAGGTAQAWTSIGGRLLQNISSGEHSGCGAEATPPVAVQTEKNSPNEPVSSTATTPPCVCPHPVEGDSQSTPSPPVVLVKPDPRGFYRTLVDGPKLHASQERPQIYSADTLAVAVVVAIVVALAIGFTAGFAISRRCCGSDGEYVSTYRDRPFHEHLNSESFKQTSFPGHDGALNDSAYLPPCSNNKPINLVLNVPPKNANGKNANSSAENKPVQKVKKTYI
ncbi:semaphorin-1A-like isoform X3 [Cloeon dipterum]|uniref:semaphorin-1A-like isoform X3 n=1 Tax=Cloeon dipterum TaxID=197152 RepID=UPI00321FBB35